MLSIERESEHCEILFNAGLCDEIFDPDYNWVYISESGPSAWLALCQDEFHEETDQEGFH